MIAEGPVTLILPVSDSISVKVITNRRELGEGGLEVFDDLKARPRLSRLRYGGGDDVEGAESSPYMPLHFSRQNFSFARLTINK